MISATVTQECLSDLPEDSPRRIETRDDAARFSGEGHTLRDEARRFGDGNVEPSEELRTLEARLVEGGAAIVVASEEITEEFLNGLISTIEGAIEEHVASGAAEAPWTWLGDVDRWENVRSAIALAEISDDTLTYCCLKHELADKLLAHSRFLDALAAYVSILRANKLDRLAMVKLALSILALWRTPAAEAQAAAFLKTAKKVDANNEHLTTLVDVIDKIIMCDDVDLMEELQVDTLSEGIIMVLLQIASSADLYQRSTPLLVS